MQRIGPEGSVWRLNPMLCVASHVLDPIQVLPSCKQQQPAVSRATAAECQRQLLGAGQWSCGRYQKLELSSQLRNRLAGQLTAQQTG